MPGVGIVGSHHLASDRVCSSRGEGQSQQTRRHRWTPHPRLHLLLCLLCLRPLCHCLCFCRQNRSKIRPWVLALALATEKGWGWSIPLLFLIHLLRLRLHRLLLPLCAQLYHGWGSHRHSPTAGAHGFNSHEKKKLYGPFTNRSQAPCSSKLIFQQQAYKQKWRWFHRQVRLPCLVFLHVVYIGVAGTFISIHLSPL